MQQKKFRFVFSSAMKDAFADFARENISVDRKTLKANWNEWVSANTSEIKAERERLAKEGCEDTFDEFVGKLYFSLRYYHMKRLRDAGARTERKKNVDFGAGAAGEAIKYRFSSLLLKVILSHIKAILSNACGDAALSPIDSYMDFISVHKKNILEEIVLYKQFQNGRVISKDECAGFMEKIKKTYQNKYYVMRQGVGAAAVAAAADKKENFRDFADSVENVSSNDDDDDFVLHVTLNNFEILRSTAKGEVMA